jgi:hypothetical protein
VDLVLCYECADLWVVAPDAKGRVVEGRALDFGPGRAPFVKLAKEMFPKDKQIQGLKERE